MFPPNWSARFILMVPVFLCLHGETCGAFEIVSHGAFADPANERVLFQVTFNQPPNFFDVDPDGNPVNAFQYWYDCVPGDDEFAGEDVVVIRGPEIRRNNAIPLRDSLNPTGEDFPGAEGWGKLRGLVPYEVDGNTLTFAAAWDELGEI